MEYIENVKSVVESLLFISNKGLSIEDITGIIGEDKSTIETAISELVTEYNEAKRGINIRKVSEGYCFYSNPDNIFYVDRLIQSQEGSRRLTKAALEVLAIIAYKQPVTRIEINNIRGVSSESALYSLKDKGLIEEKEKERHPASPILYVTTDAFLEAMGIGSVDELPPADKFAPDKESADQIREQLISSTKME